MARKYGFVKKNNKMSKIEQIQLELEEKLRLDIKNDNESI